MSTRANIIVTDGDDKLFFYRHSDGYPEGTLPTLKLFLEWVKVGKIRNNVQQAAGWLILIGANEYKTTKPEGWECQYPSDLPEEKRRYYMDDSIKIEPEGWKCGAYEPTTGLHGDIEWLYTVDLVKMTVTVESVETDWKTMEHTFVNHPEKAV